MPNSTTREEKVVKHRACDECRARKLACSKDPDGCERCQRESITCHYSEQKQMGRPRKRQFIETTQEDNHVLDPTLESLDLGPLPFNLDYDYNDSAIAEPYHTNQPTSVDDSSNLWHFGDRQIMGTTPINFKDFTLKPVNNIDPLVQAPVLSTGSTGSTDSLLFESSSPASKQPLVPCGCLASMYLALASLQQFPLDVVAALRTVRLAAAAAAATIWCPQCGSPMVEQKMPSIDGFQNLMLLGTLLPIIAHGYQRLLKMIDEETDAAVATGRTKTFDFKEYGGLCTKQTTIEGEMACIEKEMMFHDVQMPPMQWRHTVRALLRLDIYGSEDAAFHHKGLKGLVEEIEQRQRRRHMWLDALPDEEKAKLAVRPFTPGQGKCRGEQTHGCLQILEMARYALDELVIA